ncbi:MAG: DUF2935 domain-containing protein [Blautia sp.]
METYVVQSLETHLFFGRIMKEHAFFLLASFPEKEISYRRQADWFRRQFEQVLEVTVHLADGRVREKVLRSGECVTEYTEKAEHQTRLFTGIPIDIHLTREQERLEPGHVCQADERMSSRVRTLNRRVLRLLDGLISFKKMILQKVLACDLYTANYPLLIEHIIREAKWYRQIVNNMETGCAEEADEMETEAFWNQIMMEHAEFIRGLLDPTECELINSANEFALDYTRLLNTANKQDCRVREELIRSTMEITEKYRDFKAAGTRGITECNIRSIILPLLADHVLREANHYLRLLGRCSESENTCGS